jgi:hypothetical protein
MIKMNMNNKTFQKSLSKPRFKMMNNKRGNTSFDSYRRNNLLKSKLAQGLSVTTIVLIVLGILVLVLLIAGFTMGWNRFLPFIKTSNNVDATVTACEIACTTGSEYDYCSVERSVKFEGKDPEDFTCDKLANEPGIVLSCDAFECAEEKKNCEGEDGLGGNWLELGEGEECAKGSEDKTEDAADSSENQGKKCCVVKS